ncbi:MAG: hypothetical protein LUC91_00590 [Prevotella sp.]|nr:hypothetical protein [Prevotella sp.]
MRGVEDYASSSADIISYLFANDSWSGFSNVLKASSKMMQLPVIHFCSLAFYMAYALHLAEVDVPDKLTFTGMGSKYIMLLSSANTDISSLMNAVFHYAGRKDVLNNSNLRNANVSISFAANPKEVTAIGALMSLNYRTHDINPSQEVYYGYENENPERILRYSSITPEIVESVLQLFHKFTGMFNDETVTDVADVLSDLGYGVDNDVVQRLNSYAMDSFNRQKEQTNQNQNPQDRLKEPMFFWPLKHALYKIGKELAQNNNNH